MAKPTVRIGAVQFVFALGIAAIVARSAQLQIVQGEYWAKKAEEKRTERRILSARRGTLFDRNGVPLAVTQEFYHVDITSTELADPGAAIRLVTQRLASGT